MASIHGKNISVLLGGYDISGYLNDISVPREADTVDVSTFGASNKQYIAGLADGSVSGGGFWSGGANEIDAILASTFGTANNVLSVGWQGTTLGSRGDLMSGIHSSYEVAGSIGDAVGVSFEMQASSGVYSGVYVHALGAETVTGNSTSVDNGAATSNGFAMNLHVTAVSGTATPTVTSKVQHSTDNSTWVDLGTFVAATAIGGQHVTGTGTVNRYVREVHTISGTSPSLTFAVQFARKYT
jgi:hypothetical protein